MLSDPASMGKAENQNERTDQTRIGETAGLEKRQLWTSLVAECWCIADERSILEVILDALVPCHCWFSYEGFNLPHELLGADPHVWWCVRMGAAMSASSQFVW